MLAEDLNWEKKLVCRGGKTACKSWGRKVSDTAGGVALGDVCSERGFSDVISIDHSASCQVFSDFLSLAEILCLLIHLSKSSKGAQQKS